MSPVKEVPVHTEVQRYLLDLFTNYKRLCDERGLSYFVIGGTALGAIRHQGFIPWDDDIDVAMPRPDFERLCGEAPDGVLSERYAVRQSRELLYGTFDDTWVQIAHGDSEWDRRQPNLSIDIFPLDGTPNNPVLRVIHFAHCYFLFALIKVKRIKYIQETEGMKNRTSRPLAEKLLIKAGGALNALLKGVDEDRLVDRFFRVVQKYDYDAAKVAGLFTGRYRHRDFFPKAVFEPGSFVEFCGLSVRAYQEVQAYLRRLYGDDLLTPPAESDRERHGSLRVVRVKGKET